MRDDVRFPDVWRDAAPFLAAPAPDAGEAGRPDESLADAEHALATGGAAWVARLAASIRLHRAGHLPIVGRADVTRWAASDWQHAIFADVVTAAAGSDDLGVAYGRYELGGGPHETGTFVRVWQRDVTGRWRVVFETSRPESRQN